MPAMKILIVEDEANIANTIRATFSGQGHSCEICPDGETALQKLNSSSWDIMFLDIRLPGISGMEVLQQVHEQKTAVSVVMITAYGSIDFAVQAMKYGAVDFIRKPFEPGALREIVNALQERKSLQESKAISYNELLELAKRQIQEREFHKAHNTLKNALNLAPESAEAYNLLGAVTEILGDSVAAVQAYQMALKFDKGYKPALENLKRITSMEANSVGLTDMMSSLLRK